MIGDVLVVATGVALGGTLAHVGRLCVDALVERSRARRRRESDRAFAAAMSDRRRRSR